MAYTTPTTQTSGALITASVWNSQIVDNLAYLKNAPTLDGLLTLGAGQVAFPASQNASANANVLDDYEEGTYTPTWTASISNPSIGNGTLSGTYVKVGQLVCVTAKILIGSTTTFGSGRWKLSLPFTNGAADTCGTGYGVDSGSATGYPAQIDLPASVSTFDIYRADSLWNGFTGTAPFSWGDADYVVVTITYRASA